MTEKNILDWSSGRIDFSDGPVVMGVLNVTPDSFSDGGKFTGRQSAVAHGLEMARAGAAIIDVGPESTRPGAESVDTAEQIKRAIPVVESLAAETEAVISIDTRRVEVARAALDAGASMINDVTAFADERMCKLAAEKQVPVVLMHMLGSPQTMQGNPVYDDVVGQVLEFLLQRAEYVVDFGVKKEMVFIDPGIGFGKTTEHNLELLRNIDKFTATGYKVLVGASRKRFIGELTGKEAAAERIFGTAAVTALCAVKGVSIIRVHDVAETIDVIKVTNAIR